MRIPVNKKGLGMLYNMFLWEEHHAYAVSLLLSVIFVSCILFYAPAVHLSKKDFLPAEYITVVNIDKIKAPKRIVKKTITAEKNAVIEPEQQVERARGTSDEANAVDLAFYPNIAPPRLIGSLKKMYPARAKKMDIEATVNVELLIDVNGFVKNVTIIAVRLTKSLPPKLRDELMQAFSRDACTALLAARFTPPLVSGRRVPIKMELPLRFRLD